ncbi:MAG: 1-(5-phosphoribosyl)-5-[(5-phosphoribosylamino)methylideneamino]imidazole-4-carboxamide isomerase [Woeseia sp.]
MIVIPAIDLRQGKCVRLRQGDFNRETVYNDDPVQVARHYRDSGFEYLHVVDLDGARSGQQQHKDVVAKIVSATGLVVQLGGGIRDRSSLEYWLQAGVSRCVIGSLAVREPELVSGWLDEFGADSIVLALDVRTNRNQEPCLAIHGWMEDTDTTLWQAIEHFSAVDAKHVLCTDVGRDGMMSGPNLALYEELNRRYPNVQVQASGGVRNMEDLDTLRRIGCAAAITGRALLDSSITPAEVVSFLHDA